MALLFGGGILMPAGCLVGLAFPDWVLMYLIHPEHLPTGLLVGLWGSLYTAAPLAGFRMYGRPESFRGSRKLWLGFLGFSPILIIGFGWSRLTRVTYYETFHYGVDAPMLTDSALLAPLIAFSVVTLAAYTYLARKVHAHVVLCQNQNLPAPSERPTDTVRVPNLPP